MKNVEQKLIEIGCTVWEKYGRKRIYVNSDEEIEKVFGLSVDRYNSGRISSAHLNGEKISNSQAHRLLEFQPYFDCLAGKWVSNIEPLPEFAA